MVCQFAKKYIIDLIKSFFHVASPSITVDNDIHIFQNVCTETDIFVHEFHIGGGTSTLFLGRLCTDSLNILSLQKFAGLILQFVMLIRVPVGEIIILIR